jgi:DNA mismatch repair ATPase MutS
LKPLGDLERLVNRVLGHTAVPRDLGGIRVALGGIPHLKSLVESSNLQSLIPVFHAPRY